MWQIKKIDELSSLELYHLLKLRIDTFVVEQTRIYHELDDNDLIAYHLYYQDKTNSDVLAYARIFEVDDHVTFGRVVITKKLRGTGMGKQLIERILSLCQEKWPNKEIIIEAQAQVAGFYEKFGFKKSSEPFIFESTPHVEMKYRVN
ncbi:GNAT family N-acetyltransferase [Pediococcus ethanolidurans]|nr:GNAT family N-acetyltransferase [Pediococcus ethanolidurans]GEN94199.1 acetyltransferase [Pediococcus ethanolidurans]SER08495.1 ElaA protein [Pediococcus ethanolidurans]